MSHNEHLITYNGETHNLTRWSEITGIPLGSLRNRLNSGWPLEIAMTAPKGYAYKPLEERGNFKMLTLHGQRHSINTWAKITGMSKSIIYDRLALGWSDEEVLTVPKGTVRYRPKLNSCASCRYMRYFSGVNRSGKMRYCDYLNLTGHARVVYRNGVKIDRCPKKRREET